MIGTLTAGRPVGTIQWTAISAPGAYHPPHTDGSGYHTVVQVVDGGAKLWGFARRRRRAPIVTPRPATLDTGWEWSAFDDCEVLVVALKAGDKA
jgi:hypothetical protein